MKLEDIGFYTLSDARAEFSSETSPMWRCEMILTSACNFNCPYCRPLRKDCRGIMPLSRALYVVDQWSDQGLKHIRFSGGEPTLYPHLLTLVRHCRNRGVKRIAISTNGSAPRYVYEALIDAGVNDFSVSLDACCASFAEKMSGGLCVIDNVAFNIRWLARRTYVTAGVVLTDENYQEMNNIIRFADSLGVADVRIISAAQENFLLEGVLSIEPELLATHPILKYRARNIRKGRGVRGLQKHDCGTCHLMNDDSVVAGDQHFPCIIYLREGGAPIGKVGPNMRQERVAWLRTHNTHKDPICKANCLDVCIDYNNKAERLRR
jgi:molybdenum cofactor biosynthesis enzyme MoaA